MPYHLQLLNLPHVHIHRKRRHGPHTRTGTDVELGQRSVTAPTHVRPMDDVIIDSGTQQPDSPDGVKTYRLLPIFSGALIPFSIMLAIPTLTGHWYIRTENNITTEIQPNTPLLDIALGFSIACAILANIFLIVRFAERCVKQMTLASIAFLTLHDLIIIPVLTVFGVVHRVDDGFTYGQSFWFSICSTVASTVTNITLIIDYVTTKDFARSGSGLTLKQRSLVIIVMVLLFYISIGSFIVSRLLSVPFLSAIYFSVVSIETIGFGDIYPTSPGSRIFTCFYMTGGIIIIALAVSIARDAVLESAVVEFQQRLKAQKYERRLRSRWRAAVRWRLRARGLPTWIHHHSHGLPEHPHHQRWFDRFSRLFESFSRFVSCKREDPAWKFQYGPRQKRLNIEALTDADWNAAALEAGAPLSQLVPEELRVRRQEAANRSPGDPLSTRLTIENGHSHPNSSSLTHVRLGGMLAILGNFAIAVSRPESDAVHETNSVATPEVAHTTLDEKRREGGLNLPRSTTHGVPFAFSATTHEDDYHTDASLEIDAKRMLNTRLCIAFISFVVFWMTGSLIFMKTEQWTFWSAAYFCFITFSTVGYGDLSPKSPAGMSIFVFWALLGVATMTMLISVIMETFSQRYHRAIKSEALQPSPTSTSRPPLSRHPTFASGTDQVFSPTSAYNLRGNRGETPSHESGFTPRIRNTPNKLVESSSKELQAVSDPQSLQSVPMQLDHLKSLITMARAECESELNGSSSHLENLILYLEKTLQDVGHPCSDTK